MVPESRPQDDKNSSSHTSNLNEQLEVTPERASLENRTGWFSTSYTIFHRSVIAYYAGWWVDNCSLVASVELSKLTASKPNFMRCFLPPCTEKPSPSKGGDASSSPKCDPPTNSQYREKHQSGDVQAIAFDNQGNTAVLVGETNIYKVKKEQPTDTTMVNIDVFGY